jgi:hypothetical protein
VQNELEQNNAWTEKISNVEVYLCPPWLAYGWCDLNNGNIFIPCASVCKLADWWYGTYTSLADILRHEYAHSTEVLYPHLTTNAYFRNAFGMKPHVTEYAGKNPSEDFAETFMCYLRHQGRLPPRYEMVEKKWRAVERLLSKIE